MNHALWKLDGPNFKMNPGVNYSTSWNTQRANINCDLFAERIRNIRVIAPRIGDQVIIHNASISSICSTYCRFPSICISHTLLYIVSSTRCNWLLLAVYQEFLARSPLLSRRTTTFFHGARGAICEHRVSIVTRLCIVQRVSNASNMRRLTNKSCYEIFRHCSAT